MSTLVRDWAAESRFAYYGDVYRRAEAQGSGAGALSREETGLVIGLLDEMIEARRGGGESHEHRLTDLQEQLKRVGEDGTRKGEQGGGEQIRRLLHLCTSVLGAPGLRQTAQWASGKQLLSDLSQVGRYLSRKASRHGSPGLDRLIRDRVLAALDPERPSVVVSHSLGTVVALEALQEFSGPVPLFVTLGSPMATPAVVLPRLRPQPPRTPENVGRWLDFWDRDDIVVPKRKLKKYVGPNSGGVQPRSRRVDSDGLWVHTATKYLRQPAVAGPIAEAIGLLVAAS